MTLVTLHAVLLTGEPGTVRWYCWRHGSETSGAHGHAMPRAEATRLLRRHLMRVHAITLAQSAADAQLPLVADRRVQ